MVEIDELKRIQSFAVQYNNDAEQMKAIVQQYQEGIKTSEKNRETFLRQRNKWVATHLNVFIIDLQKFLGIEEVSIRYINLYSELNRFMRVKVFIDNKLTTLDYIYDKGWTYLREHE